MKSLSLIIMTLFFTATGRAAELECENLIFLMNSFLDEHLTFKNLTPQLEERTITQFIKGLDPSKLYLLESDANDLKKNLSGLNTKLKDGKCEDIDNSFVVYNKRLGESVAFVKQTLGPKYEFKKDITLILDPQKRGYSKTKAEWEELQTKYVHFQIANYLMTDMKLAEAKEHLVHRYELMLKHQSETKKTDKYAQVLNGFASSLDPHSDFMPPDSREDFDIMLNLGLKGIGATLSNQDGFTVIEALVIGGPADKSGLLQEKDKIIKVGDSREKFEMFSVVDKPLREVVKKIRGPEGTQVKLEILRMGKKKGNEKLTVTITRDKVDLKDEAAKITYIEKNTKAGKMKIGVINLPSFYGDSNRGDRSCAEDVKKLVEQAAADKVDGIVLDLSKNGGGVLGEAVRIAGLFIRRGNIVATQNTNGKVDLLPDYDKAVSYNGPLVVLTSRLSASASEIVAGALRDYKRAVIIGSDRTFGKGSVQVVKNLKNDLGAIKVTTAMFFVPGGESTQEKGVASDVIIPSPWMGKEFSEDSLDYALPKKSIPKFESAEANDANDPKKFIPLSKDIITKLQKKSQARVAKSTEFKKIEKELKETEEKNGVVNLADLMKKNAESGGKDKQKKRRRFANDPDYLKQASVQEAASIVTDLVEVERDVTLAKHAKDTSVAE